jgi:hypothetical protein
VGLAPGTYYLAALGGWSAGGAVDNAGFQSAGGETGPAVFKLVVNEYKGKLGDVNNDTQITGEDAADGTGALDQLEKLSGMEISYPLKDLDKRAINFTTVVDADKMLEEVYKFM